MGDPMTPSGTRQTPLDNELQKSKTDQNPSVMLLHAPSFGWREKKRVVGRGERREPFLLAGWNLKGDLYERRRKMETFTTNLPSHCIIFSKIHCT
jgi:hypothetical protein